MSPRWVSRSSLSFNRDFTTRSWKSRKWAPLSGVPLIEGDCDGSQHFHRKGKGKLDELDNEFDQLQVKADKAGEDVRHQWETRKLELKEKRKELSAQLDEVRNDSNSRWEDVKDSVEKTWDSTLDGLKDIKNSLFK